ncbi:MAG: hypothetical protein NTU62_16840 [Spirochaetes bacterium]|nr:hypothetical protein [Spirochaetota bacterium]
MGKVDRAARETGAVLTFDRIGIEDRFGESGKPWELMIRFGLTVEHIAARAKDLAGAAKKARGGD